MTRRLTLVILAAAVLVTACAGNDDSEGVASIEATDTTAVLAGESPEVDPEQAMLDLAACLREKGIDIDDPTVDSEGNVDFGGFRGQAQDTDVEPGTVRAAMDECAENLEGVTLGRRGDDFDVTAFQDTLVEFAACMRTNGYDMPDPDVSSLGQGPGGGGGGGPFGEIDRNDPDFIAAEEACSDILVGFRGPGSGGRGQGS